MTENGQDDALQHHPCTALICTNVTIRLILKLCHMAATNDAVNLRIGARNLSRISNPFLKKES